MAARQMSSGVLGSEQRVGTPPAPPPAVTLGGHPLGLVGTARLYVCGITPYDVTHLGHAATFVWADLLASVLHASGVPAETCRNVTDVDDVLTRAAEDRGDRYDELALRQEAQFSTSMRALQVPPPHAEPRARHYVDAVQQLAQRLLDAEAAYERDGTVWFRGAEVPRTAGLTDERARALSAEYGDDPDDPAKDDPFDVPVWRASGADDPAWPSPWGWGRPGWHAECAAMALAVVGSSVDVLVGGEDLTYPHHAYQEAMATAVTGVRPFARARLHVGEVRVAGEKMAKSRGNLVLVEDLLAGTSTGTAVPPAALRLLLLDRDHTTAWEFEPSALARAQQRLERLFAAAGRPGPDDSHDGGPDADAALAALRRDLDVPTALAIAEERGGETARRLIRTLRLG